MVALMEDVDIESRSQNTLQSVDGEAPARKKGLCMGTLQKPGIPREVHKSG